MTRTLFNRTENLEELLLRAARPKFVFVAMVDYENRAKAKESGFVWDKIVPREWAKRMPAEDAALLPFEVFCAGV